MKKIWIFKKYLNFWKIIMKIIMKIFEIGDYFRKSHKDQFHKVWHHFVNKNSKNLLNVVNPLFNKQHAVRYLV
jgi:hypothetical protein